MMKLWSSFVLILLVFITGTAGAVQVERVTIAARQPGVFHDSVDSAVNTRTGHTLVIYRKHTGGASKRSIWGRLIRPDGTPTGSSFQLVNGPATFAPRLAFNPDLNQFVLVYSNAITGTNRFEVFAQKLTSTGRRAGAAVRVSPQEDRGKNIANYHSHVIYDATNSAYVVIWLRAAHTAGTNLQQGLFGAVLNGNLTVRKAPVLMSPSLGDGFSTRGPNVSELAFHGPSKKLLITGHTVSTEPGFSFQYFVARADATLQNPRITLTKLKPGLSSGAAPYSSFLKLPGGNLVGLFVEGTGIKRRGINKNGTPSGATSLFFSGPAQQIPLEFPVTAFASDGSRSESVALGLDDSFSGSARLWIQTANSSGRASAPASEIQSNFAGVNRSVITPLPIASTTAFWFAVVVVEGAQTGAPGDSSGLTLLKVHTVR